MKLSITVLTVAVLCSLLHRIGAETLHVPFQSVRNVVVIATSINGSCALDLILDTGMGFDGVYLFHGKLLGDIDTSNMIQVKVPGAGSGEPSSALMLEYGTLAFGDVTVDSQRVIVSTSSYTQAFPSDGVIGWSLFGHYIVSIDYESEMITLYDEDFAEPDTSWRMIPITLSKNIPFLAASVGVVEGESSGVVLYVDLASGEALELLTRLDQRYSLPDNLSPSYLGTGLSGDIYGSSGRIRHLWLGDYLLSDIPTAFAPAEVRSKQEGADGIIGNDSMRRFNVIFDYPHNRLYLKANKYYSLPFEQ